MVRSIKESQKDITHDPLSEELISYWGGVVRHYHFIGGGHPDALLSTPHGLTAVGRAADIAEAKNVLRI